MNLSDLINTLQENDLTPLETEKIILQISGLKDKNAINFLYQRLLNPNISFSERSTIAIALGEFEANIAVPAIIDYIKESTENNYKAEFLSSLLDLECTQHFIFFVEIFCNSGIECRLLCSRLIMDRLNLVDNNTKNEALAILYRHKILYEFKVNNGNNVSEYTSRLGHIRNVINVIGES